MATIPALTVPIKGELLTAANGLKCCPCTDNAIIQDTPLDQVPAASTMAPSLQTFTVMGPQGMQEIQAPCVIPVCTDCRTRQLGVKSKTGLFTP